MKVCLKEDTKLSKCIVFIASKNCFIYLSNISLFRFTNVTMRVYVIAASVIHSSTIYTIISIQYFHICRLALEFTI